MDPASLERLAQLRSGGRAVVRLPRGGAAAPFSLRGGCVREAAAGLFAVGGRGRLCPHPEVLPVARTEPGP